MNFSFVLSYNMVHLLQLMTKRDMEDFIMIENHAFQVNDKGHLEIGGLDAVQLAEEYGTPLYVYDIEKVRANCRVFTETFNESQVSSQVTYASKAFSYIAILLVIKAEGLILDSVIEEEGLSLDVVSEGELYTALKAGFPVEKIHMHGNNKSRQELQMAVDNNIGCIIIDNFYEIELLTEILQEKNEQMDVLLRLTP